MKIAVNKCYGGFSPSMKAYREYLKLKKKKSFLYHQTKYEHSDGKEEYSRIDNIDKEIDIGCFFCYTKDLGKKVNKLPNKSMIFLDNDEIRVDKDFIKVVEKLGDEVNTSVSKIKIVEIPDDVEWVIDEYDGIETIHEKHRSW